MNSAANSMASKKLGRTAQRPRGLTPETLLKAGILRDTTQPLQAIAKARALLQQGRYSEARAVAAAHINTGNSLHAAMIAELLAEMALKDGKEDARALLDLALQRFNAQRDSFGSARVQQRIGELMRLGGHLEAADRFYEQAAKTFEELGHTGHLSLLDSERALVRLAQGEVAKAFVFIERSVIRAEQLGLPRVEALVRLVRARILSQRGMTTAAVRDLLKAERVLGVSANQIDPATMRLARAETLLFAGSHKRAAVGLQRLLVDVVNIEDVQLRADLHRLLGEALMESDPKAAMRHLERGKKLYGALSADYFAIQCDLFLLRLGADATSSTVDMRHVQSTCTEQWGPLHAQLQLYWAARDLNTKKERATQRALAVRSQAESRGDAALLQEANAFLLNNQLVDENTRRTLQHQHASHLAALHDINPTASHAGFQAVTPQPFDMNEKTHPINQSPMQLFSRNKLSQPVSNPRPALRRPSWMGALRSPPETSLA